MIAPLVYLIDDDDELLSLLSRRFMASGCRVETFKNSKSFLQAIDGTRPNLIVVDLSLNEEASGFDLIRYTRSKYPTDLPILILSGDSDPEHIVEGLELGANDYILKPPFRWDFEETVARYLKQDSSIIPSFQTINPDKKEATMVFRVSILELFPNRITVWSDHLIKRGTSFYLTGEAIEKMIPNCNRILVTAMGSAAKLIGHEKVYFTRVEIDPSQETALQRIKIFLQTSRAKQLERE